MNLLYHELELNSSFLFVCLNMIFDLCILSKLINNWQLNLKRKKNKIKINKLVTSIFLKKKLKIHIKFSFILTVKSETIRNSFPPKNKKIKKIEQKEHLHFDIMINSTILIKWSWITTTKNIEFYIYIDLENDQYDEWYIITINWFVDINSLDGNEFVLSFIIEFFVFFCFEKKIGNIVTMWINDIINHSQSNNSKNIVLFNFGREAKKKRERGKRKYYYKSIEIIYKNIESILIYVHEFQ